VFGVPLNSAGEDLSLDVTAHLREVFGAERVADPGNVLLDDRPLVKVGRHVVRGGADQLDSAGIRLGDTAWRL
jgi:hypothetical protein